MDALGFSAARREEQHVAIAQETLGTNGVQDRPGVDARGDLKGNTGWKVGFNQSCDHINRRSLGCQNQMNPGRSPHLCQPGDRLLDFPTDRQHQIG